MLDFFKCENSRDGQDNVENENCDITIANDCVNIAFVCKGQLISERNFGVFKSPKKLTFSVRISALASKMGQI